MFTKAFALDLLERAISTFAQAFLGAYAVVGPLKALIAAGIAAGFSALKCLAATQTGAPDSGSLLPANVDPPVEGEAVARVQPIAEDPHPLRLGRHVEHDARSRLYPAPTGVDVKSVRWQRRSPIFDQGNVGSCTGNAAAGWLATDNARRKGWDNITEDIAVAIYSKATHLDRIKGYYPKDDTGSSGLAAAKAMRALGFTADAYRHAFGLEHALQALQSGPVLVGIAWRASCDSPDANGLVHYTGPVRGGHEILADEVDTERKLVGFTNSWSDRWGASGRFYMTFSDFAAALAQRGDVTVLS
ncbi:MAG: hypothetical protein ACXV5Q_00615 [Frankiaceae bacterium]